MKISELIRDIVRTAEDKFGVSDHMNDSIGIDMFCCGDDDEFDDTWQVALTRPSQNELARGEIEDVSTCKLCEMTSAFHTQAPTLLDALLQLHSKVDGAWGWDCE